MRSSTYDTIRVSSLEMTRENVTQAEEISRAPGVADQLKGSMEYVRIFEGGLRPPSNYSRVMQNLWKCCYNRGYSKIMRNFYNILLFINYCVFEKLHFTISIVELPQAYVKFFFNS